MCFQPLWKITSHLPWDTIISKSNCQDFVHLNSTFIQILNLIDVISDHEKGYLDILQLTLAHADTSNDELIIDFNGVDSDPDSETENDSTTFGTSVQHQIRKVRCTSIEEVIMRGVSLPTSGVFGVNHVKSLLSDLSFVIRSFGISKRFVSLRLN